MITAQICFYFELIASIISGCKKNFPTKSLPKKEIFSAEKHKYVPLSWKVGTKNAIIHVHDSTTLEDRELHAALVVFYPLD